MIKKTKIVCTIGPASANVDTLLKMIKSGMNVARLNMSHGTYEEHRKLIKSIRAAAKKTNFAFFNYYRRRYYIDCSRGLLRFLLSRHQPVFRSASPFAGASLNCFGN